ncbi:MAG: nucleoside hydrolase [Bacteroidales bacterium]|jgi:inosine-uridine nucleoside N-ribohydrolase|nr:nucleoside hydrolase [Bacteroidales bacterium]
MKNVLLGILVCNIFLSCTTKNNSIKTSNNCHIPVIFETDMGNDIDDALALDLLYKAMDDGLVDIIGISNHKQSDYATTFIDIMNTWYGYPDIPIALAAKPVPNNHAADYTEAICKMMLDDKEAFARTKKEKDIEESVNMYRRLLSAQPDHSVVLVSVGFSTSLALLLDSKADQYSKLSGKELVAQKIKLTSVMGGSFGEKKRAEFNIENDIPAAQKFFAEWPTPIVLSPFEAGVMVQFPSTVIENDFGWTALHPVVEGYKAYRPMPYNRATWDLTSVLYVLHPDTDMFTRTEQGTIHVDEKGYTYFTPKENGNVKWLYIDKDQAVRMKKWFIDNITRKPEKYNR